MEIKAGVCYFLWDKAHTGDCSVTSVRGKETQGPFSRKLDEYDIFVRDGRAISILHKVLNRSEPPINTILTRDTAFGLASNFEGFDKQTDSGSISLYFIRRMKRSVGYIAREKIIKSAGLIDMWKVLVPEAYNGGDGLPHQILGKPLIAPPPSACTQSYLVFYVDSQTAAESLQSYYATRFFRFLVSQRKITQHALNSTYMWVPIQAWDRLWTDSKLYEKYGITEDEKTFIESQVKFLNIGDADND